MTVLHIDFETRSTLDLKKVGTDVYSKHPTTDVWCMAWSIDNGPVNIWKRGDPYPFPHPLVRIIDHGEVVAHNAPFEWAIWNNIMVPRYGWPELRIEQMRCTMAQSYAMALPGSLEQAGAAVGLEAQKDMKGRRLMLQMAQPREVKEHPNLPAPVITWWDTPDRLERLYAYCKTDVEAERQLDTRLLKLPRAERELWIIDQRINQRGIYVDRKTAQAALKVVQCEQEFLAARIRLLSSGAISVPSAVAQIKEWMRGRGVDTSSIAKADVVDLLSQQSLPSDVREVLTIRQEAGKSSTAKLQAMLDACSSDGRLRGMFQYHAAGTGRWGGRRVQLQNLPRPKLSQGEIEGVIDWLNRMPTDKARENIDIFYGPPLQVISDCLRAMLCAAPGHVLTAADYANIEGRVLAWLAGEEWKLGAFREYDAGTGPDLYKLAYGRAFNIAPAAVDKDQRQVGKVMELALGYQGGVVAFQTMGKGYGVKVTDVQAEMFRDRWREAHSAVTRLWYDLEDAALSAMLNSGFSVHVNKPNCTISFRKKGSFLWCKLPSGRNLCYPYPRVESIVTPWGAEKEAVTYMGVNSVTKKWERQKTYGGFWAENITQAVARDILAEAIVRLERNEIPVVLHCHDEAVAETATSAVNLKAFEEIMAERPAWAHGLPIAVEGWTGERYRK